MIQVLFVTGFVLIHLFAGNLWIVDSRPRSRWLSMAGGISVAYVFIHIFPELAETQQKIQEGWHLMPWIEHHAYLVALCGLIAFYGLEKMVISSKRQRRKEPGAHDDETTTGIGVFWIHISSFVIYNALIGYLLVHREEQDLRGLIFFFIAMAVHFLVNDYALRKNHKRTYKRIGRWVLTAGIIMGWAAGLATTISEAAIGVLFAFLAGGVVLNVLKEELPEERQNQFFHFALGAGIYSILLLL